MTKVEQRLLDAGISLPDCPVPVAAYLPGQTTKELVFASGQTAWVDNTLKYIGKLGKEISVEEGYESAKVSALRCISELRSMHDLDNLRIVRVKGYVNATEDFKDHPLVINGASEIIQMAFGENGKHARAAVGMGSLPGGASVEIEVIAEKIK